MTTAATETLTRDLETILDALNVRALDRQADRYGDAGADDAADLYLALTQTDVHEERSEHVLTDAGAHRLKLALDAARRPAAAL